MKTTEPIVPTELGLALILAMADGSLRPPKRGIPGIRCEYRRGQLRVSAEGYIAPGAAEAALERARRVCEDAGLVIGDRAPESFTVRRR